MPRLLLCALTLAAIVGRAHAATAWDEAVSGDFSNAGANPTVVSLATGSNLVSGTTGRHAGGVDRDYFTFTLADGWQLDSINVLPGSTFLGGSGVSFIGVQAGAQVVVNPTGGSAAGLLSWWHFGENDLGTDILPLIGIGMGASGFLGSLPAGSYAFWLQDTGAGSAAYRLDFSVSAVPEPSSAMLLFGSLVALGALRRRCR